MAVIGKIRSYSGLLIAIIGLGLAAFVLQDFLGSGPARQRGPMEVGSVDKNKISHNEFNQRFNMELESHRRRTGVDNVEQQVQFNLRNQTWEGLVRDYLLADEIDRVGIRLSIDEFEDLFLGANPHQLVLASFPTDPATGELDRGEMLRILDAIDANHPDLIWLEKQVKKLREQEKYFNLIKKAYYMPHDIAELQYHKENITADIRFIVKNYNQIADENVSISDEDMRLAYEEIKHLHEGDETRDVEYVVFPVFPTEEDRQKIYEDVVSLKEELKTINVINVEPFVNSVSDRRFDPSFKTEGSLPMEIDSIMFNSPVGTIHGPYRDNNYFVISMLYNVEMRPDSLSAKHALISYSGALQANPGIERTYQEAEHLADSLLNALKQNRATITDVALTHSDDPSVSFNEGDLGWFQDGQMVPEFTQAVMENPVGSYVIAETPYGFHIINATGKSSPTKKAQVAHIAREILPSGPTYQEVYAKASDFAGQVKNKNFSELAEEKDLILRDAPKIKEMQNNMPGVQNPREIIRWAFDENVKEESISRIFEIEDNFIIAHLSSISPKGIPQMAEIDEQVRNHALKQKKFEFFNDNNFASKNLDQLAAELGINVQIASNIKFKASMIPGAGREPFVIGYALIHDVGSVVGPIKGNNGIFFVEIERKDDMYTPDNLTNIQNRQKSAFANRVERMAIEALKKNAKIEDHRSWYY